MDHVVFLDTKALELEKLLAGAKTMIVRGAAGRKMPFGRVHVGDRLFFLRNNGKGQILAKAYVRSAPHFERLSPEMSEELIRKHQDQLQLTETQFKRWKGKRNLVLVEVEEVYPVDPFPISKKEFGNMDDWLLVEDINRVAIN